MSHNENSRADFEDEFILNAALGYTLMYEQSVEALDLSSEENLFINAGGPVCIDVRKSEDHLGLPTKNQIIINCDGNVHFSVARADDLDEFFYNEIMITTDGPTTSSLVWADESLGLSSKREIIINASKSAYVWIGQTNQLYHYTTQEGAQAIQTSRRINVSSTGRTASRFGKGVYLTALQPKEGEEKILRNNYDGKRTPRARKSSADCYFRFKMSDLAVARKQLSDRDIWLFPREIDLNCVHYDYGEINDTLVLDHDKINRSPD